MDEMSEGPSLEDEGRVGADRQESDTPAGDTRLSGRTANAVAGHIHGEVRQHGVGEIRVVENVEEIGPELHLHAFAHRGGLDHGEIQVPIIRSDEGVATHTANMVARIIGIAVAGAVVVVAGDGKSAQVQESERRTGPGKGIAHQVWPTEELERAVEIVLEIVDDVHGDGVQVREHLSRIRCAPLRMFAWTVVASSRPETCGM